MDTVRVIHWCYWASQPDLRYACGKASTPSWNYKPGDPPSEIMEDDYGEFYAWNPGPETNCPGCLEVHRIRGEAARRPSGKIDLYVDDERVPPDDGWVLCRDVDMAITLLDMNLVGFLSLDHDMGDRNGYEVMLFIEKNLGLANRPPPRDIYIHTANPSAREKMKLARAAIYKLAGAAGIEW